MAEEVCIASIANTLSAGTHIMSNIMLGACIVVGIALFALGGVHFKGHRHNPKLIPLSKPIMYWVLGLCLFSIPFFEEYVGATGRSAAKDIQKKTQSVHCPDIDAPIE